MRKIYKYLASDLAFLGSIKINHDGRAVSERLVDVLSDVTNHK